MRCRRRPNVDMAPPPETPIPWAGVNRRLQPKRRRAHAPVGAGVATAQQWWLSRFVTDPRTAKFFDGTLRCQEEWKTVDVLEKRRQAYRDRIGDDKLLAVLEANADEKTLVLARRSFEMHLPRDRDVLVSLLPMHTRIYYHSIFRAERAMVAQGILASGASFGVWTQRTAIRAALQRLRRPR